MKIGLNGVGRIGRHVARNILSDDRFELVHINDINPDLGNIAYTFNYDTLYGSSEKLFTASDSGLLFNKRKHIKTTHEVSSEEVDWESSGVDIIIDASGVFDNVLASRKLIVEKKVKKVLITHSPSNVDFTLVLGANEKDYDHLEHNLVATSICDATAIAPVLKVVEEEFGIMSGSVTTLHPWLNYQNLLDGPASSWSHPGEVYHHYALGRAVDGNLIPKPTTALSATFKVLPKLNPENFLSFSYRTPTAIVGSADITLSISRETTSEEVKQIFSNYEDHFEWPIMRGNCDPLVSLDFKGSEYSAVVDHRWTSVAGGKLLKLVLWYDNEYGYSKRVFDQLKYIVSKME